MFVCEHNVLLRIPCKKCEMEEETKKQYISSRPHMGMPSTWKLKEKSNGN